MASQTRAAVKRRATVLRHNVLHDSILIAVCSFLPLRSLVRATSVSKQWQKDTVGCPNLWANLDFGPFSGLSIPPQTAVVALVGRAGRSLQTLCVHRISAQEDAVWRQIITQNPLDFRQLVLSAPWDYIWVEDCHSLAQLVVRTNLKRFSNGTIFPAGWTALPLQLTINGASMMEKACSSGGQCSSSTSDLDTMRKRCCAVCGVVKCVACSWKVASNQPGWQFECLQCLRCFCIQCSLPRRFVFHGLRPPRCCWACGLS